MKPKLSLIDITDFPDWSLDRGNWPKYQGQVAPELTAKNLEFLAGKINELIITVQPDQETD